jgi:hypothetical protein
MGINRLLRHILPGRLREFSRRKSFEYREATWRDRPMPDFLIIGAQRSGTSSLYEYLREHPQLVSSSLKKEIHFFDSGAQKATDNYEKGESWYRAHFPRKQHLAAESKIFEATPLYLFHPLVPERIFKLAPETKLIALLRNPTDRAISHYFMTRRKNHEDLPMLEAFRQEEERLKKVLKGQDYKNEIFVRYTYKSRGRYREQVDRYLQYFPMQQILLLRSEEFFSDPHETLRQVFDFVGVDAGYKVGDVAPRNIGRSKSEIPGAVNDYLNEYFRPHNQALYELTKINFGW